MVLAQAQSIPYVVIKESGERKDMCCIVDRNPVVGDEPDYIYGTSLILGFQDGSHEGRISNLDRSEDRISPYGSVLCLESVLDVLDQLLLVVV